MLKASELRLMAVESLSAARSASSNDMAHIFLGAASEYSRLARDVDEAPPESIEAETNINVVVNGCASDPQAIVDALRTALQKHGSLSQGA